MGVHPTAIIHPSADLADDVEIGPFCVVDEDVKIEAGCRLYQNVYVTGNTTIGESCVIHPFALIGHEPQDLKFTGEATYCRIGPRTVIREAVQIHRGTEPGSETVIGADCYLMANSHVGHNGHIGNKVTIVNGTLLAGHVSIDDQAIISGNAVVHQFCRIGRLVMVQGHGGIGQDIVPFAVVDRMGRIAGINKIGLRRAEVPREEVLALRDAYQLLFSKRGSFRSAVEELAARGGTGVVKELVEFLQADSKRGFAGSSRSGDD